MRKKQRVLVAIGIMTLLVLLLAPVKKEALGGTVSLEGAWMWTFLIENGATDVMCFYANGTWNSPTFPCSGVWYQEGKNFKMCGDYQIDGESEAFSASGAVSKSKLKKTVFQVWYIPAGTGFWDTGTVDAVRIDIDPAAAGCPGPTPLVAPAAPGSEGSSGSTAR